MKFYLVNGEVKFLTHKVEWRKTRKERNEEGQLVDVEITETRDFYDADKKNAYINGLTERNIEYTVTEYEQPSQEIIDMVAGKRFGRKSEAQAFIEHGIEPLSLNLLAEVLSDIIGGAVGE